MRDKASKTVTIPNASTFVTFYAADGFTLCELEGCIVAPHVGDVVWLYSDPDRDASYPDDFDFEATGGWPYRVLGVEWRYYFNTSLGHQHIAHVLVEPDADSEPRGVEPRIPQANMGLSEEERAVLQNLRRARSENPALAAQILDMAEAILNRVTAA